MLSQASAVKHTLAHVTQWKAMRRWTNTQQHALDFMVPSLFTGGLFSPSYNHWLSFVKSSQALHSNTQPLDEDKKLPQQWIQWLCLPQTGPHGPHSKVEDRSSCPELHHLHTTIKHRTSPGPVLGAGSGLVVDLQSTTSLMCGQEVCVQEEARCKSSDWSSASLPAAPGSAPSVLLCWSTCQREDIMSTGDHRWCSHIMTTFSNSFPENKTTISSLLKNRLCLSKEKMFNNAFILKIFHFVLLTINESCHQPFFSISNNLLIISSVNWWLKKSENSWLNSC